MGFSNSIMLWSFRWRRASRKRYRHVGVSKATLYNIRNIIEGLHQSNIIIISLNILLCRKVESRRIRHLQFKTWPNYGVPEAVKPVAEFIAHVHTRKSGMQWRFDDKEVPIIYSNVRVSITKDIYFYSRARERGSNICTQDILTGSWFPRFGSALQWWYRSKWNLPDSISSLLTIYGHPAAQNITHILSPFSPFIKRNRASHEITKTPLDGRGK